MAASERLDSISKIFGNSSVSAGDRVKAIVREARALLELGPVIVYVRDWRCERGNSGAAHYPSFFNWFMAGVQVRAPMYGILPLRVRDWLTNPNHGRSLLIDSVQRHTVYGGKKDGFWLREEVNSYAKIALNEGADFIIFNRSNSKNKDPLKAENEKELDQICRFIEPLLSEVRRIGPTPKELERDLDVTRRLEALSQLIHTHPRGNSADISDELLAEVLEAAHEIFADRGPVLGTIFRLERCEKHTRLQLRNRCYSGIPDQLLKGYVPGDPASLTVREAIPVRSVPRPGEGITSWVAHHEIALLIEDTLALQNEQQNRHLNILEWYKPFWNGVRTEMAVPIKDPLEARLTGVFNFESRSPGAFEPSDVYYLERFAQQAGAILRQARIDQITRDLHPKITTPFAAGQTDERKKIAHDIADFLMADAATIWTKPPYSHLGNGALNPAGTQPPSITLWGAHFGTAAEPTTIIRRDGFTSQIMDSDTPPVFLLELAYLKDAVEGSTWFDSKNGWKFRALKFLKDQQRHSACWVERDGATESQVKGPNESVIKDQYYMEMGVPLHASDPGKKPLGVLWIKWKQWKSDQLHLRPTREDVATVGKVAQSLALAIEAQQVLDHAYCAGASHDMNSVVWEPAINAFTLCGPLHKAFARYAYSVRGIYVACTSAPPRSAKICGSGEGPSVRDTVLSALAIGAGKYPNNFETLAKELGGDGWEIDANDELNKMRFDLESHDLVIVALVGLVVNARRNAPSGGKFKMAVNIKRPNGDDSEGENEVVISVHNRCELADDETNKKMRESLKSGTKGLALAQTVAKRLLGELLTESVKNTVTVTLSFLYQEINNMSDSIATANSNADTMKLHAEVS